MRLALACGQPNVDAMLTGMSAEQMTEWMAFGNLEPFGQKLLTEYLAWILATIYNASGHVKNPLKPEQFLPPKPKSQRAQEFWADLKSWAIHMGAKRVKRQDPSHGAPKSPYRVLRDGAPAQDDR